METQTERDSVIHRKAKVARDEYDARAMSPSKALRLALEKAADRLFALALTVSTVEQVKLAHAEVGKDVGDDGLIVLLDGQDGAFGALKFDLAFLSAVVEVQIKGKVMAGDVEPRPVTRTDAAMAASLIDAVLEGMDQQMATVFPDYPGAGFRFGDLVEDARSMSLTLDAPDYDVLRLTADIGQGAKTGLLTVILPHVPPDKDHAENAGDRAGRVFDLRDHAMNAPVTLDAVVARISMPLDKICELAPGACVPVDAASLSDTELLGASGHVVARVKLGQLNGFRAVRLVRSDAGDIPAEMSDPHQSGGAGHQKIGTLSAALTPGPQVPAQGPFAQSAADMMLTPPGVLDGPDTSTLLDLEPATGQDAGASTLMGLSDGGLLQDV